MLISESENEFDCEYGDILLKLKLLASESSSYMGSPKSLRPWVEVIKDSGISCDDLRLLYSEAVENPSLLTAKKFSVYSIVDWKKNKKDKITFKSLVENIKKRDEEEEEKNEEINTELTANQKYWYKKAMMLKYKARKREGERS